MKKIEIISKSNSYIAMNVGTLQDGVRIAAEPKWKK